MATYLRPAPLVLLLLGCFACGSDESSEPERVYVQAQPGTELEDGAQGPRGERGEKGEKGDDGERGEKGEATATNEWRDPVAGSWWLIGAPAVPFAADACGKNHHVPTLDEAKEAHLHGIFVAFPDMGGSIWTTALGEYMGNPRSIALLENGQEDATTSATIVCVRNDSSI